MVFIPKPGLNLTITKSWRPLNLINYMRKLGKKVVVDRIQDFGGTLPSLAVRDGAGSVSGGCPLPLGGEGAEVFGHRRRGWIEVLRCEGRVPERCRQRGFGFLRRCG